MALTPSWSLPGDDLMSRHSVGSRLYTPPRFNGVVKAVENKNKGRDYTKIGNLDIIQE